ncbi:hypothetical protein LTR27_004729 [Elasticomyces elasticus]|nr:hypothetical protein LTR27_004729 [Elasticomyces elasticus]
MATSPLFLPELLENILLHLPIQELLHLQVVCTSWRACVKSSPKIQQALMFRCVSVKPVHWHSDSKLKAHWCDLPRDTKDQRDTSRRLCAQGQNRADLFLNPFFANFVLHSGISTGTTAFEDFPWNMINYQALRLPWNAAQPGSGSSISHMLLTNPPTSEVHLMPPRWRHDGVGVYARNTAGVTMEDIAAEIERHITACETCQNEATPDMSRYQTYGTYWTLAGFTRLESVQTDPNGWAVLEDLARPYSEATRMRVMAQNPGTGEEDE